MSAFRTFCGVVCLLGSSMALADADSHAREAERFLKLTRADQMSTQVYLQVRQAFEQRYAEQPVPGKRALLERYQLKAEAVLDRSLAWDTLKPEMISLYTGAFSEQELAQLIAFYRTPLGAKLLDTLPALNLASARLTQRQVQKAAPEVNRLLTEMSAELAAGKPRTE